MTTELDKQIYQDYKDAKRNQETEQDKDLFSKRNMMRLAYQFVMKNYLI